MAEGYLKELYDIEDRDDNGAYPKAKRELKKLKSKNTHQNTFYVCENESDSVRQYVAKRFVKDGLYAIAYTLVHEFYDGVETSEDCVKVVIPERKTV